MWTILLSLLPYLLKLVGFVLDKNQADAELQQKFLDLINAYHNSGLISLTMKDDLSSMREKLAARIAAGEKPGDTPIKPT